MIRGFNTEARYILAEESVGRGTHIISGIDAEQVDVSHWRR